MRVSSQAVMAGAALLLMGMGNAALAGSDRDSPITAIIAVGMICNTPDQAKQFLELRVQGRESHEAMETVNRQAHSPHACGLAAIAYVPDQTLDSKQVANKLLQVVRITIIAGFNGTDWQRMSGSTIQYAVLEAEGPSI